MMRVIATLMTNICGVNDGLTGLSDMLCVLFEDSGFHGVECVRDF